MTRRPRWGLSLLVAFVVVPLVEIYVLIQVGQVIRPWWTILLLVVDSVLGSWLIKREGVRAWGALTNAVSTGRVPGAELADGALILIGGTMMLTPGFVTDLVGVLLILPVTRPAFRKLLVAAVTRSVVRRATRPPGAPPTPPAEPGPGPVVRGDVVD